MDIQAKRAQYLTRQEELKKYSNELAAEHTRVERSLIALSGAIEALDDLLKEEVSSAGNSDGVDP